MDSPEGVPPVEERRLERCGRRFGPTELENRPNRLELRRNCYPVGIDALVVSTERVRMLRAARGEPLLDLEDLGAACDVHDCPPVPEPTAGLHQPPEPLHPTTVFPVEDSTETSEPFLEV